MNFTKYFSLWQNQYVRNILLDIRFSVTYVVSLFRLLEQGSPKSVKEEDKTLVDAFQLRSSLWRFCYKIWLREGTRLITVSTFRNATSNLWSWKISITFTASNAHMPEAQLFSVSYILIQHVTIEPMRLTFYPAFLLNVEPTARRDWCQFSFTFVYCTFSAPNLDEIHRIDIDTNSLNRNSIRGNFLLLYLFYTFGNRQLSRLFLNNFLDYSRMGKQKIKLSIHVSISIFLCHCFSLQNRCCNLNSLGSVLNLGF